MDSPASAAKISKADTPPQEYSDAETDKTVSDRDEEGDNASDGAAADTEQAVSGPVQSTDTVGAHSAEDVDNNSVPPAQSEDSHPEETVAAEADVEQENIAAKEQADVDVQKKSSPGAAVAGDPIVDPRSAGEGLNKIP